MYLRLCECTEVSISDSSPFWVRVPLIRLSLNLWRTSNSLKGTQFHVVFGQPHTEIPTGNQNQSQKPLIQLQERKWTQSKDSQEVRSWHLNVTNVTCLHFQCDSGDESAGQPGTIFAQMQVFSSSPNSLPSLTIRKMTWLSFYK